MSELEYRQQRVTNSTFISVTCTVCLCTGEITPSNLSRYSISCDCNGLHRWKTKKKYDILVKQCIDLNARLMTPFGEQWVKLANASFKPSIQCLKCHTIVTTTPIHGIVKDKQLGCKCRKNGLYNTKERYDELIAICISRQVNLVSPFDNNWKKNAHNHFMPIFVCMRCDETVTTTSISNFTQHNALGCLCSLSAFHRNTLLAIRELWPFKVTYNVKLKFNKHELEMDLVGYNGDNNIVFFCEADGALHFIMNKKWGGKKQFKKTVQRDLLRNQFSEQSNIPMLRIHYKDESNLKEIVRDFLEAQEHTDFKEGGVTYSRREEYEAHYRSAKHQFKRTR